MGAHVRSPSAATLGTQESSAAAAIANRRSSFMSIASVTADDIYGEVVKETPKGHTDTSLFSVNANKEWALNVSKIDWTMK